MKFLCDQCRTKYSIDDARVRGKVLKIRCKQCNHVITVRESGAASAPADPSPLEKALAESFGAPEPDDRGERTQISVGPSIAMMSAIAAKPRPSLLASEEWYVSFDGEQEGPYTLERAASRVRIETGKGKEAYAWRDGFDGWLPVSEVPEFARWLRAPTPKPTAGKPLVVQPAAIAVPIVARPSAKMDLSAAVRSTAVAWESRPNLPAAGAAGDSSHGPPPPDSGGIPEPDLVIGDASVVVPLASLTPGSFGQAPVLVMAGPAPSRYPIWFKWAIGGAALLVVALTSAVIYLALRPKSAGPTYVFEGRPIQEGFAGVVVDNGPTGSRKLPTPQRLEYKAQKAPARPVPRPPAGPRPPTPAAAINPLADLYRDSKDFNLPSAPRSETARTSVSQSDILGVMTRNKKSLTQCYESVLKHDSSLKSAKIEVEVNIGISGSVTRVSLPDTYAGSEIGVCLVRAIRRWHFPAQDSEYATSFPLLLQAQ